MHVTKLASWSGQQLEPALSYLDGSVGEAPVATVALKNL
jgi:hypothetical protein